ncbi:MAG: hypothetical protein AAGE37_06295 [Pseudomonadota bacterium]
MDVGNYKKYEGFWVEEYESARFYSLDAIPSSFANYEDGIAIRIDEAAKHLIYQNLGLEFNNRDVRRFRISFWGNKLTNPTRHRSAWRNHYVVRKVDQVELIESRDVGNQD